MCSFCTDSLSFKEITESGKQNYKNMHGFCKSFRRKLTVWQAEKGGKICRKCGVDKPFNKFPPHKNMYDGFDSWCRECRKNYRYETKQSLDSFVRAVLRRIRDDRRKLECTLTLSYLIKLWEMQKGLCAISGEKMMYQRTPRQHNAYNGSLDRINSSNGYVEGNVQWVCWNVNRMKGEHATIDLVRWCDKIIKNQKGDES